MSSGRGLSREPTGNAAIIVVIIALAVVTISGAVIYSVWMVRKTLRATSARKNQHILERLPVQPTSEEETLEMGHAFAKSESYAGAEPFVFPYFRPHNLAAYLPPAPPRAHVPEIFPIAPPGLPLCRVSNVARAPVVIVNSTHVHHSVKIVWGHVGDDSPCSLEVHPGQLLASSSLISMTPTVEEFGPGDDPNIPKPQFLVERSEVPALTLNDGGEESERIFKPEISHETEKPPNSERALITAKDTLSNFPSCPVSLVASSSSLQLPSPPPTPTLPTLVVTSASIARCLVAQKSESLPSAYYPSPPQTPTLVITSPSIHYFAMDVVVKEQPGGTGDEAENWSDVLGLEDYVDDETFVLESPPVRRREQSLFAKNRRWQSTRDNENQGDVQAEAPEVPFDHAAFLARLAAFTLANQKDRVAHPLTTEYQTVRPPTTPLSSNAGFDYGRLLARKRANSTLTNSPTPTQRARSVQIPASALCRERTRALPGCV